MIKGKVSRLVIRVSMGKLEWGWIGGVVVMVDVLVIIVRCLGW